MNENNELSVDTHVSCLIIENDYQEDCDCGYCEETRKKLKDGTLTAFMVADRPRVEIL